jgi:drug/metabolite transporter (DMT)-like permease
MGNEARSGATILITIFTALAGDLAFQPSRFANTPSYANLLAIAAPHVWAIAYAVAAVLMATSIWGTASRIIFSATHTINILLITSWWVAFIFRWLTDSKTTIVNVISWGVFLCLAIRSALVADAHRDS